MTESSNRDFYGVPTGSRWANESWHWVTRILRPISPGVPVGWIGQFVPTGVSTRPTCGDCNAVEATRSARTRLGFAAATCRTASNLGSISRGVWPDCGSPWHGCSR